VSIQEAVGFSKISLRRGGSAIQDFVPKVPISYAYQEEASMELRHLRYFVAVAEAAHFRRAAERLHVSQPALSQQIQDLEEEVGTALFQRHARGVTLTAAGSVFLEYAEAALATVAEGAVKAREAAGGQTIRITVGIAETSAAAALALRAIKLLSKSRPDVIVEVNGLAWLEQLAAVEAGTLDVGFCWSPGADKPEPRSYPATIAATRLHADPGDHALLPARHALAQRMALTADELKAVPFGLFDRTLHPALHDAIADATRSARAGAVILASGVASASSSTPLLIAREGWTLVTRSVGREPLPGTVAVPLSGFSLPAGLDVIYRKDSASSALPAFLAALRTASDTAEPAPADTQK
jgi:DNA-binding transcriptional LysR family regulator